MTNTMIKGPKGPREPCVFDKPLVFVGTGRCGTGYAAKMFQTAGVRIGHEKWKADGISHWRFGCLSHWPHFAKMMGVWSTAPTSAFKIIHVVREPLACIKSLMTLTGGTWDNASKIYPLDKTRGKLHMAMSHWAFHNQMCGNAASVRVRVEDFTANVASQLTGGRIPARRFKPRSIPDQKKYNTRRPFHGSLNKVTWKMMKERDPLLYNFIRRQAARYGYNVK